MLSVLTMLTTFRPNREPVEPADEGVTPVSGDVQGAGHLIERDPAEGSEALEAGGRERPEELGKDVAVRRGQVGGAEHPVQAGGGGPVRHTGQVGTREIAKVGVGGLLSARRQDAKPGAG